MRGPSATPCRRRSFIVSVVCRPPANNNRDVLRSIYFREELFYNIGYRTAVLGELSTSPQSNSLLPPREHVTVAVYKNDVTQILNAIDRGDPSAADRLLPLVYDELRRLAVQRLMREKPGQTLQATALVHEAYIRLVDVDQRQNWNSRGHFFAAAAEAMRRILVERARHKASLKAGSAHDRVDLTDSQLNALFSLPPDCQANLLDLDRALEKLERLHPRNAELVKLRFFAGLTCEEAAQSLGVSAATAGRLWSYARSWLQVELSELRGEDEFA